jgi:hypothetical protein
VLVGSIVRTEEHLEFRFISRRFENCGMVIGTGCSYLEPLLVD